MLAVADSDDEAEARRALAVRMYQEGQTIASITKATGMGQSSIYWALQKAGVEPGRLKRAGEEAGLSPVGQALYEDMAARLADLEDAVAEMRLLLAESRADRAELRGMVDVGRVEREKLQDRLESHATMLRMYERLLRPSS